MWSIDRQRADGGIPVYWILIALPALFLLIFFVLPNAFLLSAGFLRSENQVLTDELTLENFRYFLTRPVYLAAIFRTFFIGASVGLLVAFVSFPLAYFLIRTNSRFKGVLIALSLAPLLASVVVRTYGWYVVLDRFGTLNEILLALNLITERIAFIPSTGGIIVGLAHALLPYGVLTNLASLSTFNPNLEKAAMSLGASRTKTFLLVVLPHCMPGLVASFLLAFSISISAYATPAILGGPSSQTIATLVYTFMMQVLDWSLGAALATILIVSTVLVLYLSSRLGGKRASL